MRARKEADLAEMEHAHAQLMASLREMTEDLIAGRRIRRRDPRSARAKRLSDALEAETCNQVSSGIYQFFSIRHRFVSPATFKNPERGGEDISASRLLCPPLDYAVLSLLPRPKPLASHGVGEVGFIWVPSKPTPAL